MILLLAACSSGLHPKTDIDADVPDRLSDLGLVDWDFDAGAPLYAEEVTEYTLHTPLFTDYAVKFRAVYLPEGTAASPGGPAGVLDFPVGTHILKTFAVADDLTAADPALSVVETRLLRRTSEGWETWPYLWEDGQATLAVAGDVQSHDFVDPHGVSRTATYLVPQRNQCTECHSVEDSDYLVPIGPKPQHLVELADWVDRGLVTGLELADVAPTTDFDAVDVDTVTGEALDAAARDYLDINCAHCHRPEAVQGVTSQLFLNRENTEPFNLGVCKIPGSAGLGGGGLTYDIVPGDPDASILYFRLSTEEVGAMMPLLGRSLTHTEGATLIRRWIAEMPADDCE